MERISESLIRKIISRIILHPDFAKAIKKAILGGEGADCYPQDQFARNTVWVRAEEVGVMIGRSSSWVRQHRQIWSTSRYEARGKKGCWWFDKNTACQCYNIYLESKFL